MDKPICYKSNWYWLIGPIKGWVWRIQLKTKVIVYFGGECQLEAWRGSSCLDEILIAWQVPKIVNCGLSETHTVVVESVLVKGRVKCCQIQEAGRWNEGGCNTKKCSWFDGLVITGFVGHLIDDG